MKKWFQTFWLKRNIRAYGGVMVVWGERDSIQMAKFAGKYAGFLSDREKILLRDLFVKGKMRQAGKYPIPRNRDMVDFTYETIYNLYEDSDKKRNH